MNLYKQLELNIGHLKETFKDCGDVVSRKLPIGKNKDIWIYITYIDMLIDRKLIEISVLSNLMTNKSDVGEGVLKNDIYETLKDRGIATADLTESSDFADLNAAILSGDTVIVIDGCDKALIISTKGFPNRGIPESDNEVAIQGSKEAFNEVIRFNSVLIRRRIKDTNLKLQQMKIGRKSQTDIGIMYLQDIVRPDVLKDVLKKLENIDIDSIMDSGSLEQLIEDNWLSPFPQTQVTERPDKAASAILEGRIVILVDNSPFALIVPATFDVFFQASDDYYQRWQIVFFMRILRFIGGIICIALPGLYLAMAVFHPSMIPMFLTFKLAGARQFVPFPAVIEILIMEMAFELLREAGIRLPGPAGGAIGIIGGLIVGDAAVSAGIVSPIVVIIVALTGIASFSIPQYSLTTGFRIMKYLITISSAVLGLFGFWVALIIILIHMTSLKSFGFPYLHPFVSGDINNYTDLKDTIIRVPLFKMKKRPIFSNPEQTIRLKEKQTGNKKDKE